MMKQQRICIHKSIDFHINPKKGSFKRKKRRQRKKILSFIQEEIIKKSLIKNGRRYKKNLINEEIFF